MCFDAATEGITEGPPPAHGPPVVGLLRDLTLLLGPGACYLQLLVPGTSGAHQALSFVCSPPASYSGIRLFFTSQLM